jgi:hypothetical protein
MLLFGGKLCFSGKKKSNQYYFASSNQPVQQKIEPCSWRKKGKKNIWDLEAFKK